MLDLGVITEQSEPTSWVNSITIVKKAEKMWVYLDPTKLNVAIKWGVYHTKRFEEIVANTASARYFSVLDAMTGYWQIELNHESSLLCSFSTPWEQYCYSCLPFGIKTAGNIFIHEMNKLFGDLECVGIVTDDILCMAACLKNITTYI